MGRFGFKLGSRFGVRVRHRTLILDEASNVASMLRSSAKPDATAILWLRKKSEVRSQKQESRSKLEVRRRVWVGIGLGFLQHVPSP